MRGLIAVFLLALGFAVAGSTSANAQSVMKQCGAQWQAAKAEGTTNGLTWPQFLSQCRAQLNAGSTAPAAAAPAPAPTYGQAPATGVGKTTSQCDAEYAANKAAIKASGQTKRAFVAACRAGNEIIPQGTATAPAAAPAPAPSMQTVPAPPPTQAAPVPAAPPTTNNYATTPTPMGAGEFASDQLARAHCQADTVVWVNTKSHIYHFAGTHNYGHTKEGAYMCEADAKAAGDRAALNETHP